MERIINNYGILASVLWNSNKWEDFPTKSDMDGGHGYPKDTGHSYDCLNFAQHKLPLEPDGTYVGYTPAFNKLPRFKANLKVVFLKARNYREGASYLIGMYVLPEVKDFLNLNRPERYAICDWGNMKCHPSNILRFDNYIPIDESTLQRNNCLPNGNRMARMTFNYLNSENVRNIFELILMKNRNNPALDALIKKVMG